MTRLVMIEGASPGVGKTTLASGLVDAFNRTGELTAFVPENIVLERGDLRWITDAIRAGAWPTPAGLLEAFRQLSADWATVDWVIMDRSWLPTHLPWAQASQPMLVEFARGILHCASSFDPSVIFVDDDPDAALSRAARRDGEHRHSQHLAYVRALPAMRCHAGLGDSELIAAYGRRFLEVWKAAGASPIIVDASAGQAAALTIAFRALTE